MGIKESNQTKSSCTHPYFPCEKVIFFISLQNVYSKICVIRPLSKSVKIGFQDQLSHNAGQKYCRMLQGEHSAILLTCIKLPVVIKTFVLSIFEWPFYTGFTILYVLLIYISCISLICIR